MRAAASLLAVALAGCTPAPAPSPWAVDQCLRADLFKQCLTAAPAGPQAARFNDWAEVVSECGDQAYKTALRERSGIKPECRAGD